MLAPPAVPDDDGPVSDLIRALVWKGNLETRPPVTVAPRCIARFRSHLAEQDALDATLARYREASPDVEAA